MVVRRFVVIVGCSCVVTAVFVSLLYSVSPADKMTWENRDERTEISTSGNSQRVIEKIKNVRLLCWVPTTLQNLQSKARYVKMTWGKRCDVMLFIGSEEDKAFPVIKVNVPEGRDTLSAKTQAAMKYVYENYKDKADWFLKADDDSFVIVDNLKYFLSDYNPSAGLYFGYTFKRFISQGYNSGGGGYVLSHEALKRFYVKGTMGKICPINHSSEDVYVGLCLNHLGVRNVNTLDEKKRTRFHSFHIFQHMDNSNSYVRQYTYYGHKKGVQDISNFPVSFHYVRGEDMRLMEFLIYHVKHVSQEGTVLK